MLEGNLLEPIRFATYHEAQKFILSHACGLCTGNLMVGANNSIRCPACDQSIYQHTVIRKKIADEIQGNLSAATLELSREGKPLRDEKTILKELGF